jgi:hypothetical protein
VTRADPEWPWLSHRVRPPRRSLPTSRASLCGHESKHAVDRPSILPRVRAQLGDRPEHRRPQFRPSTRDRLMTRLCLFGDGPAVPGGSRCRKHRGTPNREGPNPYTRSYREERKRILTPDAVCYLCGGAPTPTDPLEADHVVPLSLGGEHRGNLRPAHRSCNRRKGGARG